MSRLPRACRSLVALFSLAAVLLGALEHEALILQPDVPPCASSPAGDQTASELISPDADNGTEGTFRSEKHPQASPQGRVGRLHSLVRMRRADFTVVRALPAEAIFCPRIVGVVILRL